MALLTDFGAMDPYVGAMKGAILSVCPEATLVDLAHEVPPHDVLAGALTLHAACRTFPAGTVFVAVVDPGVGSPRRGLALRAGPHLFVGPDNGLFSFVLREHPQARIHGLENSRLFRSPVSPSSTAATCSAPSRDTWRRASAWGRWGRRWRTRSSWRHRSRGS